MSKLKTQDLAESEKSSEYESDPELTPLENHKRRMFKEICRMTKQLYKKDAEDRLYNLRQQFQKGLLPIMKMKDLYTNMIELKKKTEYQKFAD